VGLWALGRLLAQVGPPLVENRQYDFIFGSRRRKSQHMLHHLLMISQKDAERNLIFSLYLSLGSI